MMEGAGPDPGSPSPRRRVWPAEETWSPPAGPEPAGRLRPPGGRARLREGPRGHVMDRGAGQGALAGVRGRQRGKEDEQLLSAVGWRREEDTRAMNLRVSVRGRVMRPRRGGGGTCPAPDAGEETHRDGGLPHTLWPNFRVLACFLTSGLHVVLDVPNQNEHLPTSSYWRPFGRSPHGPPHVPLQWAHPSLGMLTRPLCPTLGHTVPQGMSKGSSQGGGVFGARIPGGASLQPPFPTAEGEGGRSKANGFRGGKQIGFLKNAPLLMIGGVIHNPGAGSVLKSMFCADSLSLMGKISHTIGP